MKRRTGAAAALLGGVLLTLPLNTAPAHATGHGSITASISGVPSKLPLGGSFEISVTSRSTSDDSILVDFLDLTLWQRSGGSTAGVSVQWQDPGTGQWVDAQPAGGGGWGLGGRRGLVTVAPHGTLVTHARVSMGSVAPGSYAISTAGINGYELLGPSGDPIAAHLDGIEPAQVSFTHGSGSAAAPRPTPTSPSPAPAKSAAARSTTVPDAPATDAPSEGVAATPTATATPTAADLPSPTPSADTAGSPSPSRSTTPLTTVNSSTRTAIGPLVLGVGALAAVAVTMTVVQRRRRAHAQHADD